ncbi:hypothetical protein U0070_005775, partial [Myodes glareolus]
GTEILKAGAQGEVQLPGHVIDVYMLDILQEATGEVLSVLQQSSAEAPTLLAALFRDCRILGEAVKLLQVTDCKSPLNGEFLSQLQFCEAIDDQHLQKEMTVTNQKREEIKHLQIKREGPWVSQLPPRQTLRTSATSETTVHEAPKSSIVYNAAWASGYSDI